MVHAVVLNADIFYIICQSLPRGTLSTLARTAKVLHDPALRKLWRYVTQFVYLLFPLGDAVCRTGKKFYFTNVPTPTQWERFRFYAQYVRILGMGYEYDYRFESSCLSMLFRHQPLLPQLESLHVSSYWASSAISTISIFFVASIRTFEIEFSQQDTLAIESLIATLAVSAPALRDLTISVAPTGRREFGPSLSFFQSLCSIEIPLAGLQVHSVLSHLASLPSLSNITFHISNSARLSGTGTKYPFTAVKELTFETDSHRQALQFMSITQFDNLTDLEITCGSGSDPNGDSLYRAISDSCGQHLKHINVAGDLIEAHNGPEPLKFSTICPLFKFTNLLSFTLFTTHIFWPTDEEMQSISKSWPHLEMLDLSLLMLHQSARSPLTLTGLLSLIRQCTDLVNITVAVNAEEIPNLTIPIVRPGLKIEIHIKDSPIECPEPLANFLSLVLPDANFEIYDPNQCENRALWKEALSLRESSIKDGQEAEQHAI